MLKASSLNFVGNVEGHDLFTGQGGRGRDGRLHRQRGAEGLRDLRRARDRPDPRGARAATCAGGSGRCSSSPPSGPPEARSDPSEIGGAPLLGREGLLRDRPRPVERPRAVKHGIRTAAEFHASGVNAAIEGELCRPRAARTEAASA